MAQQFDLKADTSIVSTFDRAGSEERGWQANFVQKINDRKGAPVRTEDDNQIDAIVNDTRNLLRARYSTDLKEWLQTSQLMDLLAHDVACLTEKDLDRLLPKINEQLRDERFELRIDSGILQVGTIQTREPYSLLGPVRKDKDPACLNY